MMTLLLAMAWDASTASPKQPCIPIASDRLKPTSSALDAHAALREALGELMPEAPIRVALYGRGGHHSTEEYSIVLARNTDGIWHGTAVGRSQIWVEDAPYTPLPRKEWVVDQDKGRQLDAALARHCRFDRSTVLAGDAGPPPLGRMAETIDVVRSSRPTISYSAGDGDGVIAALIRPPR